ncbi:Oidioi.mRNA.OKI2018_I69.XSR.g16821.t1.cds [Oikopleura dioica]|uniref:Oidioi.mRNA.OKI2018_I69.XSR.g16821.t1.cds n=1 Tax=Oikopleura dioica TaxID=34765 RepID=A0ABN7SHC2_OIKDI|nr:Oidioi.mRNA.OKI2018_I69.XSR.g16821.t1.cds [Oikopleura dioica]
MKFSAALFVIAQAQSDEADRGYYFQDYYNTNIYAGKTGQDASYNKYGLANGNRRYCHATPKQKQIRHWDITEHGYFSSGNYYPVECFGHDMFCYIEERAQFGQIVNIQAGCAQMMNHPGSTIANESDLVSQIYKLYYNKEAARGDEISYHYGIGGCLALPAQNGYDSRSGGDTDDDFKKNLKDNRWMGLHGGFGLNQCLRLHEKDGPKAALRLGPSICRACCLATPHYYQDGMTGDALTKNYLCNHLPYKSSTAGEPEIPDKTAFDCETTVAWCRKEITPNFGQYSVPDYNAYYNLFDLPTSSDTDTFCDGGTCTPE